MKVLRAVLIGGLLIGMAGVLSPRPNVPRPLASTLGTLCVEAQNIPGGASLQLRDMNTNRLVGRVRIDDAAVKQILFIHLNGKPCVAVLLDGPKDAVRFYRVEPHGLHEMWRGIRSSLRPWKIAIADVDGDGNEELAVGVYKKARYHPVMANRLFIFGWDGEDVYAKWMGSRLSRPFTDFAFADFGTGMKLVAIEKMQDGRDELALYFWDNFGFTGEGRGACAKQLSNLHVCGQPGAQYVSIAGDRERRAYVWNGRKLVRK